MKTTALNCYWCGGGEDFWRKITFLEISRLKATRPSIHVDTSATVTNRLLFSGINTGPKYQWLTDMVYQALPRLEVAMDQSQLTIYNLNKIEIQLLLLW